MAPQEAPRRLQNAALVSATQAQTPALQVLPEAHAPQLATVRERPQLSVVVRLPQARPARVQSCASVSGTQAQVPCALHVAGLWQLPQLVMVRALPQLSVALSGPHGRPMRAQRFRLDSGTQTHWPCAEQLLPLVQVPHEATKRAAPHRSVTDSAPQVLAAAAQS
jgi:hypothetical protein